MFISRRFPYINKASFERWSSIKSSLPPCDNGFTEWLVTEIHIIMANVSSTHCGLVTPYGEVDLGQHGFRQWLVAWRHQAITWANVDVSLMVFCATHLRPILQKISIHKMSLKNIFRATSVSGANELNHQYHTSSLYHLTHLPIVSHICVSDSGHWFR